MDKTVNINGKEYKISPLTIREYKGFSEVITLFSSKYKTEEFAKKDQSEKLAMMFTDAPEQLLKALEQASKIPADEIDKSGAKGASDIIDAVFEVNDFLEVGGKILGLLAGLGVKLK